LASLRADRLSDVRRHSHIYDPRVLVEAADRPESVLWDDWHVVAEITTLEQFGRMTSTLFERELLITREDKAVHVAYADGSGRIASTLKYGYVWASLGAGDRELVDFPEAAETDRHVLTVGSLGIRTSGLRLVENFIDVAHFPFVHTGYLGAEPDTEVQPYTIRVSADEVWVESGSCTQPMASAAAPGAAQIGYVFRVLRPYTVVLYKTNTHAPTRQDLLLLMVQPVSQERCIAHVLALVLNFEDARDIRSFQRLITGQDKPILENQRPSRLPLDPRSELPVRADAAGTAYRRWLVERGVSYGAIPPIRAVAFVG
jgi:phenylpropionate dioxygenase-like ring-hydroxylating dioxygenase large terminal subunit